MRFCSLLGLIVSVLISSLIGVDAHSQSSSKSPLSLPPIRAGSSGYLLKNADMMDRDADKGIVVLTGNVQVVFGEQHLSCDQAIIYENRNEVEAIGHLRMVSATTYLEGDSAVFNYKTNTGTIRNGFVRAGKVAFEGETVLKLGEDEYEADRAYYTTCATCPPAWAFTGSRIKARMGGYAHIRNSVLKFAHVPFFWLPYLIVPLKSERQTGFLIPSLDYSGEGGTAFVVPFFWAMDRSQDSTWTLQKYQKRGLKGLLNYRYMLSESSHGEMTTGWIQDRVFVGTEELRRSYPNGQEPTKFNRWFLTYGHMYSLPDGFEQKTKINLLGDLRYPRDFSDDMPGAGDPALENRISLTRNSEHIHTSLDADYYINMLKSNPLADNQDAVHRFPEIRFNIAEQQIAETGLLFRLDTDYVNFARQDLGFDDVYVGTDKKRHTCPSRSSADCTDLDNPADAATFGKFTAGDQIRAGQRLDILPEMSYPIPLGRYLDILPSVGYRFTKYAFAVNTDSTPNFDTDPQRQYVKARVSARTHFNAIYETDPADFRADKYKHEIVPEAIVSTIPWFEQSDSPFFGKDSKISALLANQPISDTEFQPGVSGLPPRGIQFDYNDRITNRNIVAFVLTNKLIRKTWKNDTPDYRQVVNFRLSQSYDYDEAKKTSDPRFAWSDIEAKLTTTFNRFDSSTIINYFPYHSKTNTQTTLRLRDSENRYVFVTASQIFSISEDMSEAYKKRIESLGFGAGLTSQYVDFVGAIYFRPEEWWQPKYRTTRWNGILTLKPPGNCSFIRATMTQEVGKKPDFKFNFGLSYSG